MDEDKSRLHSIVDVPEGEVDDTRFEKLVSWFESLLPSDVGSPLRVQALERLVSLDVALVVQIGLIHPDPHVVACVTRIAGLMCSCEKGLQLFSAAMPEVIEQLVSASRDVSERQRTAGFEALTRVCSHEQGASHFYHGNHNQHTHNHSKHNNIDLVEGLLVPAFHDSSLYVRAESAKFLFVLLGYEGCAELLDLSQMNSHLVDIEKDFRTNPDTHELLVLSLVELAALALTTSPETVMIAGRSHAPISANMVLSKLRVLPQLLVALRVDVCSRLSLVALDAVVDVLSVAMTSSIAQRWLESEGFCQQLVDVCLEHLNSPQPRVGIRASSATAPVAKRSNVAVLALFAKLVEMLTRMCPRYPLLCSAIGDFLPFLPANTPWIETVLLSMSHLIEEATGRRREGEEAANVESGVVEQRVWEERVKEVDAVADGEEKKGASSDVVTTLTLSQFARTKRTRSSAVHEETQAKKTKTQEEWSVSCNSSGHKHQPAFLVSALLAVVKLLQTAHMCGSSGEWFVDERAMRDIQLLLVSLVRHSLSVVTSPLLQAQVLRLLSDVGNLAVPGFVSALQDCSRSEHTEVRQASLLCAAAMLLKADPQHTGRGVKAEGLVSSLERMVFAGLTDADAAVRSAALRQLDKCRMPREGRDEREGREGRDEWTIVMEGGAKDAEESVRKLSLEFLAWAIKTQEILPVLFTHIPTLQQTFSKCLVDWDWEVKSAGACVLEALLSRQFSSSTAPPAPSTTATSSSSLSPPPGSPVSAASWGALCSRLDAFTLLQTLTSDPDRPVRERAWECLLRLSLSFPSQLQALLSLDPQQIRECAARQSLHEVYRSREEDFFPADSLETVLDCY